MVESDGVAWAELFSSHGPAVGLVFCAEFEAIFAVALGDVVDALHEFLTACVVWWVEPVELLWGVGGFDGAQ